MQRYKVEIARGEDEDTLSALVIEHCQVLGKKYDEDKVRSSVYNFLFGGDFNKVPLILIDTEDKSIVGYLLFILTEDLVSYGWNAVELGFYCKAKGQGQLLIKEFENYAKSCEAQYTALSSHDTDRLDRYYANKGYTIKEKIFVKALDYVDRSTELKELN